jgi:hypothetical protein
MLQNDFSPKRKKQKKIAEVGGLHHDIRKEKLSFRALDSNSINRKHGWKSTEPTKKF